MYNFTGEYECKIDAKGRVRLPSSLIKQIPNIDLGFTLNRGYEKHLILLPKEVWDKRREAIDRLNIYKPEERKLIRFFYRGATQISLDSNDRILIPKNLTDYAQMGSEVVVFAYQDQIEIWSKEGYNIMIDEEPESFSDLADKVFGNNSHSASE